MCILSEINFFLLALLKHFKGDGLKGKQKKC